MGKWVNGCLGTWTDEHMGTSRYAGFGAACSSGSAAVKQKKNRRGGRRHKARTADVSAEQHCNKARSLYQRNDYDAAEQEYRAAIAMDPEHARTRCELGILLSKVTARTTTVVRNRNV